MSPFFCAPAIAGAFFVITKGVKMPRVSYMGDGTTTEFMFNFPYFQNTDIVVTKNTDAATGYTIVGTSAGENADIPYSGGKVVFETAPTVSDTITIARNLPPARITDYQPMVKIEPTTLNQDMNYMMEVLKDMKDNLGVLSAQYADIADKESTTDLLARIAAIHDEIDEVTTKINALGDIDSINTDINDLKNASNFSVIGKAEISHLAMPSGTSVDLTVGPSGTTYVASADGYINFCMKSTAAGQMVQLYTGVNVNAFSTAANQTLRIFAPIKKGREYQVDYTAPTVGYLKLVYLEGSN